MMDSMKLIYNSTTRGTQNPPGVSTRVADFGKCSSVEYISSLKLPGTSYFVTMVQRLIDIGYVRDKNILAAPYDFRRTIYELNDFFADLKKLVETAYSENANRPIVFICHSNGCQNNVYFLSTQTQNWKDKYVRSVIAMAGNWAGSVKPLLAYTFGLNVGPFVQPGVVKRLFGSFPSVAGSLPSEESFTANDVLIKNGDQNYTIMDYKRLFNDLYHPDGYEMWLDAHKFLSPLPIPNVELHCLHGYDVKTMEQFNWNSGGFPDKTPEIKYGDGDGTINISSLQACKKYKHLQEKPFYYKTFAKIAHQPVIEDRIVFEYIQGVLLDQVNWLFSVYLIVIQADNADKVNCNTRFDTILGCNI